jgi:hypothetical protein
LAIGEAEMKNTLTFVWTMVAFCVLDIMLVCWMLKFSGRIENPRLTPEVVDTTSAEDLKPTPLGVAAMRALLQR